jgi:hypothetical protein
MSSQSRRRRRRRKKRLQARARRDRSAVLRRSRELADRRAARVLATVPDSQVRDVSWRLAVRYATTALFLVFPMVATVFVPLDPAMAVGAGLLFLIWQLGTAMEEGSLPAVLREMDWGNILVLDLALLMTGVGFQAALGPPAFVMAVFLLLFFGFVIHQLLGHEPARGITFLPSRGAGSVTPEAGPARPHEIRFLGPAPAAPARSEGPECGYCAVALSPGEERQTCRSCGIAHHIDCWRAAGSCTTFGCEETRARRTTG